MHPAHGDFVQRIRTRTVRRDVVALQAEPETLAQSVRVAGQLSVGQAEVGVQVAVRQEVALGQCAAGQQREGLKMSTRAGISLYCMYICI